MGRFVSSIWDFGQTTVEESGYATHDFFRWYGKLVPQLVRRVLTMYSVPGDIVLANFAGSGTVLVEADLLKRKVIGLDSNRLSALICRSKLMSKLPDLSEFYSQYQKIGDAPLRLVELPQADKWFSPHALEEISRLRQAIDRVGDPNARGLLQVALASIVRNASRIDERSINHIVVDFKKQDRDVRVLFKERLERMQEGILEFASLEPAGRAEVMQGDARLLPFHDDSFRLVISHPPYLGAIDFSNIHQLSVKILGLDYDRTRASDMSTNRYHSYVLDLQTILREALRVCLPGGVVCLIIGDNRKDGFLQPTFVDAVEYMRSQHVPLEDVFIWLLTRKAGLNVARRGHHIDHNYILIFRKPAHHSSR